MPPPPGYVITSEQQMKLLWNLLVRRVKGNAFFCYNLRITLPLYIIITFIIRIEKITHNKMFFVFFV